MSWGKAPAEQRFEVGELTEGKYTVHISPKDLDTTYEREFKRPYFPWEGNALGETNAIHPPFTPIEIDDQMVEMVLRRHDVGGLGFWDSVKIARNNRKDEYKDLLAAPMKLRTADGECA